MTHDTVMVTVIITGSYDIEKNIEDSETNNIL